MRFFKYINTIPESPTINGEPASFGPGDIIAVRKGSASNYRWETHKVAADGFIYSASITLDEWTRLNQLQQTDIDKLKDDYTKAEIDSITNVLEQAIENGVIQSTASFVAPTGTVLPTPSTNNNFTIVGESAYTGGGGIPAKEGYMRIATWNGTSYNVVGEVKMLMPEGTDTLQDESIPKGKAVKDYATPLDSERILPYGNNFNNIDRPDIPLMGDIPLFVEGENGEILGRVTANAIIVDKTKDRPDIKGVVFEDENGNILAITNESNSSGGVDEDKVKDLIRDSEYTPAFYEPPTQEAYNNGTSQNEYWKNYDYYGIFDEAGVNQKTAVGYSPYITRDYLGKSTMGGYDIYRYEFKPPSPTNKIILFGSIHGQERIAAMVLLRFFKNLTSNWAKDPVLTWFKNNIHVVVIPLASPYGFKERSRRVPETAPFPATWTKVGNRVTVNFNVEDFPNTNPNVSGSNYFTASPSSSIVNKLYISFIDSSNQTLVPNNGYMIKEVINGQTVAFDAPAGTADGSGTCSIYVSTDPNRGFDLPNSPWANATPSTTTFSAYNEPVAVPYDNKGTKPLSLNESKYVMDTYTLHSDANLAVDIHNGAADYDTRWNPGYGIDISPIQKMNDLHYGFTDQQFYYRTDTLSDNASGYIGSQMFDMTSFTIEWGGYNNVTEEIATESQRWIGNFILQASKYYNKKLN